MIYRLIDRYIDGYGQRKIKSDKESQRYREIFSYIDGQIDVQNDRYKFVRYMYNGIETVRERLRYTEIYRHNHTYIEIDIQVK